MNQVSATLLMRSHLLLCQRCQRPASHQGCNDQSWSSKTFDLQKEREKKKKKERKEGSKEVRDDVLLSFVSTELGLTRVAGWMKGGLAGVFGRCIWQVSGQGRVLKPCLLRETRSLCLSSQVVKRACWWVAATTWTTYFTPTLTQRKINQKVERAWKKGRRKKGQKGKVKEENWRTLAGIIVLFIIVFPVQVRGNGTRSNGGGESQDQQQHNQTTGRKQKKQTETTTTDVSAAAERWRNRVAPLTTHPACQPPF